MGDDDRYVCGDEPPSRNDSCEKIGWPRGWRICEKELRRLETEDGIFVLGAMALLVCGMLMGLE